MLVTATIGKEQLPWPVKALHRYSQQRVLESSLPCTNLSARYLSISKLIFNRPY
jgi:hypothetical protein